MNRGAMALCAALACAACAHPNPRPAPGYALRDTTAWSNMMYGGTMALLTHDGHVIDTVDLLIGIRVVPGGIVYQPIRRAAHENEECEPRGKCFDLRPWVLRTGEATRDLTEFVPGMDPFFSSPNVIDSVLYYWGVTTAGSGSFSISARRYDFRTAAADSTYLFSEGLETDNPGHFIAPVLDGNVIVYRTFSRRFLLTRELRVVSEERQRNQEVDQVPSDDPLRPTPPFDRVHDVDAEQPDRPVVRLTNLILSECIGAGFERIRFGPEPDDKGIPIRYGRGDEWRHVMTIPTPAYVPLVNRVKVMANLDITRHVRQLGKLRVRLRDVEHVFDVTVTPTDAGVEEVLLTLADSARPGGPSA